MSGAHELLMRLEALGVILRADGRRLLVSATVGRLDAELRRQIARQKLELIRLLAKRESGSGAHAQAPEGRFPVSFAQRRLWFLDRLEPDSIAYNLGAQHFIGAAVDATALEAAFNDVIRRQPALRTVFVEIDGEPVQVVQSFSPQLLTLYDLSALPEDEQHEATAQLTLQEAKKPFDLAKGPLVRAALVTLGLEAHKFLYTVHHIVCDGWSLGVLLADLSVAYAARQADKLPEMSPLTTYYGAYAATERQRLGGPALTPLLDYWRRRLSGAAPVLELPTDRPRPSTRNFSGAAATFTFSPELSDALRALARRERATLYTTLLALFKVLLYRLSGQGDIVVGTPVANRPTPALEPLVGLFVSTLPIRSELTPGMTLHELIAQLRETVIEAQTHADLPFEKMVDELRPERSLAVSPMFQVVFALQNTPLASNFEVTTVGAMYDLSLFIRDEPGGIRGAFEFSSALFDATTVHRWCQHLQTLAESAVASTAALNHPISRLPLLNSAMREQILSDWNNTARPYERDASLGELFMRCAECWPAHVALENSDPAMEILPQAQLTYRELARAALLMAAQLQAAGVRRGDPVGLYMERSMGAVVALLAIVVAGGAYVPLDPADPPARTEGILADAGVKLVLTQRSLATRTQVARSQRCVTIEELWELLSTGASAPHLLAQNSGGENLAYLMFTSGTTGRPKGVCVSHRNVARLVRHSNFIQLGPEEIMLQFAPLAFDAATLEIWGALLNGARLVVQPQPVVTAAELADTLCRHQVSTLWLTAGLFHHMIEQELTTLAGVRQVLAGGDVLSASHVQRLLDAKHELGIGGVVINGYGPTENTTFTCCHIMRPGERLQGTVPIGRPIANTTVYLLDECGQPVPPGVTGEIFAGGDGVARAYLTDDAANAEKFLPDPFAGRPGARMYRTGDLARWQASGNIEFLGRRDRQVKIRGFRVELQDVEQALRRCAGVRDAAVLARTDSVGTNGLVGYLVRAEGVRSEHTAIKRALAERLPAYMVPGCLIDLPSLPLTSNGKLDRAALPEPVLTPAQRAVVEPHTMVEAQLHAIWEQVLGHTGFGITDNFFELGGHSLLAVRLFAKIETAFKVKLPVSALFAAPDIAQLAHKLEHSGIVSPWSTLVQIRPEGGAPPLFMVPGIGGNVVCYGDMARHLTPGQPLYGLQSRGLNEREEPFDRIESMATHYLSEVRRLQPHGPYHLGGTCFGGVVAYEMAQQLRAAGQVVKTLFLLETWPPSHRRSLLEALQIGSHQMVFVLSAVRRHLGQIWRTPIHQWFVALRARVAIVHEIVATGDVYRGDRLSMYVDRVSLANRRALLRYRIKPYAGPLRCAMATRRRFSGEDSRRQWRTLAPADYAEFELPAADSGLMLLPPHVEPLARWINAELAQSDVDSSSTSTQSSEKDA